ncbi:transcription-repair coupling factor [Thiomicrorhabdus xiamenensis]|uniref:Transcription-repair-coupling factor n=1 Tax=Thiomicrorhabdus xiamenensis TaxID=2739063 RepID=A0A7D4SIV9_9GAMM|nr:transcription-repair coupling factor [Thiomicrorhabdus xiamenensis]QKI89259.1 transcription-repair coupling factor [Thiomicrorhabdus xiamenensis]
MAVKKQNFFPLSDFTVAGHRSVTTPLNLASSALFISQLQQQHPFCLVLAADSQKASQLQQQIEYFATDNDGCPVFTLPEWETLPYDQFSPHQDLISERLRTLHYLPKTRSGILVIPSNLLNQQLIPQTFLAQFTFLFKKGDRLDQEQLIQQLDISGYQRVSQVMEHGDYAVRGGIIDLFPMGSKTPFRLDLFDDEIDSIRSFDPETQRTTHSIDAVDLLPAKEFNLNRQGIDTFKQNFRHYFGDDARNSQLYRQVSDGESIGGLEYYLPFFHKQTATLFDYLPQETLVIDFDSIEEALEKNLKEYQERYQVGQYNSDFPLIKPQDLLIPSDQVMHGLKSYHRISISAEDSAKKATHKFNRHNLPNLGIESQSDYPLARLNSFLDQHDQPVIFCAESTGRRETLMTVLRKQLTQKSAQTPEVCQSWQELQNWLNKAHTSRQLATAIIVAPLEESIYFDDICLITEAEIFGQTVLQRRRRNRKHQDFDTAIANLVELEEGSPIVHIDHGVGRYLGLETMDVRGTAHEFLKIQYANEAMLYVPVSSLHLISRYTGATPETAPLHKLGSDKWDKAKQKAAQKAHDVAAELLDIYAQRAARKGYAFELEDDAYARFVAGFPFEETPDQYIAIESVLADMKSAQPMDRLVCGDVGFGKTEVAMRAAFIAAHAGRQVAMLVPTTLLAHQHFENFRNRFADWPIRIEVLSRFQNAKEQKTILADLADGKVDIIIGTHKLIQKDVKYKQIGLIIIDEEHRFGVRQKEQLKKIRAQVDVLTMTATPIPRTLNMAMNDLRDLSIIATPPAKRLAVQTFVQQWNPETVREACLREIRRGGQVYLLYNHVDRIERMVEQMQELIPEAKITYAHGQMNEKQLESVMEDFYHRRFNILVCTTIIETGIDIPTANTILIHRADKFGLAQLHQLRGRVGRSHHKAYAYLFTGDKAMLTKDAEKRLSAIAKHNTLGAGFMLASHDLEIRGAGELLGSGQSGQIQEIGFGLYSEILDKSVKALKSGKQPELNTQLHYGCEVDLDEPALIPEDYLPDVHSRLVLYKRLASAETLESLRDLEVEMIDRFGLLPFQVKNLIAVTEIKLLVEPLGIIKIDASEAMIRIVFNEQPDIDPLKLIQLIQKHPKNYQMKGQSELKFFDTMPTLEERTAAIELLIKQIRPS